MLNSWPVIVRELRAEARRPVNHWVRLLAAGAVISVCVLVMTVSLVPPMFLGAALFGALHATLFLTFLVVVPLMTADCVSAERREGTLGLLFLTPLTAFDIVAGKSLVHLLRAATLFLAAIPVLTVPFLIGGVGWRDAVAAVAFEACAVLLGAAAGLLATSRGGTATQAMVVAELYSAGLAWLFRIALEVMDTAPIAGFVMARQGFGGPPGTLRRLVVTQAMSRQAYPAGWGTWVGVVTGPWQVQPFGRSVMVMVSAALFISLALFALAVSITVRRLERTWDQEPAAPEQPRWVRLFSGSGFWRAVFRWNKSRTLDRNPIAWLQEYSWTARLTKWGWCLVVFFSEWLVLNTTNWNAAVIQDWQWPLTVAVVLGLSFSAVSSFRREHQTGMLELLLVTPISVRHLVGGRLWGVWGHFFPAMAVLAVGWIGDTLLSSNAFVSRSGPLLWLATVSSFFALPVIGLYFALGRLHVLVAWGATLAAGLLLPLSLVAVLPLVKAMYGTLVYERPVSDPAWPLYVFCGSQLALAAVSGLRLQHNLAGRRFALSSAVG